MLSNNAMSLFAKIKGQQTEFKNPRSLGGVFLHNLELVQAFKVFFLHNSDMVQDNFQYNLEQV